MPELPVDESSNLVIESQYFPPFSVRGASQSLQPIQQSSVQKRTVNGELINLAQLQFRKFRSTITCADQNPPPFSGYWSGMPVTVECIATLSYRTSGGIAERPVVDSWVEGDFTIYRPELEMMVIDWNTDEDEWGAVIAWSLNLEEI